MIINLFRPGHTPVTLVSLFLGLAALLILIIAPWQVKVQERPGEIRSRFEAFLQEHELHLRKELSTVAETILADSMTPLTAEQLLRIPMPADEEMTLFIYQGDSLVYWSDNQIPFELSSQPHGSVDPGLVRLANGWYERIIVRRGIFSLAGLCLVKQEYPFQNQYLRNHYIGTTGIPEAVEISLDPGRYKVHSFDGAYLCSLDIPAGLPAPNDQEWLTVILLIAYLFLGAFLYRTLTVSGAVGKNPASRMLVLVAVVILIRSAQFITRWPHVLYQTELFGPALYSSSELIPSLGDFLVNSFLVLLLAALFYHSWPQGNPLHPLRNPKRLGGLSLRFLLSAAGLILVLAATRSLVIHSVIPLNLENVSRLTWNSFPAFISLGFLALSWSLVTLKLALPAPPATGDAPARERKFPLGWFFLSLALFSVCATLVMNKTNRLREKQERELLAIRLATRENPVTEQLLQQSLRAIEADTAVFNSIDRAYGSSNFVMPDDSLVSYLLRRYFREYWNNFNVQITVCRPSKILRIQPQGYELPCPDYFEEVIASFGKESQEAIYYLDYGYGNENYMARIPVPGREEVLYLEISSRGSYKDLGYPELLVDRSSYNVPDPGEYSYAFYKGNRLIHRVGEFVYGFGLAGYADTATRSLLPTNDRMDHFLYPVTDTETLLISRPKADLINLISPFSYLFIFLSLFGAVCVGLLKLKEITSMMIRSLRNRLQLSMLGMILTLFVITGVLMMIYLFWLNSEKNEENLMERTLSILIEVEHKFDHLADLQDTGAGELENVLIKFSNVFFSDINLFDPQGILLASSRPRIFREGLLSDLMNRQAFNRLQDKSSSMFVQVERIGKLDYLSAYVPFYNTQNKLLGYLNLPYFSRQDDLRREISTFLVAFINIYLLFILLGVLVTYLVSTYITAPLKLLAQRIGRIRLGFTNDKLIWKREDEIGKLVEEYNRMLDELAISAEKLAVSERESAWREMAQQVAHEIKNPLTPMRLGVQYLQKAWEDRAGDWEIRLKRFTDALLVQIDTLSAIASEFSYFARMPEPENERFSLDELIKDSLAMYKDVPSITLEFHPSPEDKWIYADRRQLLRVLSNLINNAVEAIEAHPGVAGKIVVKTGNREGGHWITITDNGKGILAEDSERIFQPSFTTRSGGAGLGLAIVKSILNSTGGSVSFTSEPGKTTTFTIWLPAALPPEAGGDQRAQSPG